MIPLRLVVDTNIVVSAALKPDGLQRTVLLLSITKPARLYISDAILAEYLEVLARPELKPGRASAGNSFSSSSAARIPSPRRARSG
ncbi:MAG: PIN domain-containing protein [Bryobacteraceae bacterium]